eukprot:4147414-Prymnesium_polylepis.1
MELAAAFAADRAALQEQKRVYSSAAPGETSYSAPACGRLAGSQAAASASVPPGALVNALLQRHSSRGATWKGVQLSRGGIGDGRGGEIMALDDEIVRMIKERIVRCKPALRVSLQACTHVAPGIVSVGAWAECLTSVLGLDLPWSYYRPWLAEVTSMRDGDAEGIAYDE